MATHRRSILTALTLGAAMLLPGTANAAVEQIQQPEPEQTSHFSIFRGAPEGLPPTVATIIDVAMRTPPREVGSLAGTGLNPALAQKLDAYGGRPLWVVPGSGDMVLVNWAPGRGGVSVTGTAPGTRNAPSTRSVIRHGIRSGEVGLVPDGVIGVRVSKVVTVPVGPDHTYSIAPAFKHHKAASFWKYPTLIYGSRSPAVKSGSRIG